MSLNQGDYSMNAIIYSRVSTNNKEQEISKEDQPKYLRRVAKKKNWTIVGEYSDVASGRKEDRANYRKMINHIKSGGVDVIMVRDQSRLTRSVKGFAEVLELCEKKKVKIYEAKKDNIIDPEDSGQRMISSIVSIIAENEARNTTERLKQASRERTERGIAPAVGNTLFGYDITFGDETRKLETVMYKKNPSEAIIVKDFFERYLNGEGTAVLAKEYAARGIKTHRGKSITKDSLLTILHNEKYCGIFIKGKGTDHPTIERNSPQIEPIISEEQFYKAQEICKNRDNVPNRKERITPIGKRWWTGVLFCPCGRPLHRVPYKPEKGGDRFVCAGQKTKACTLGTSISKRIMIKAITKFRLEFQQPQFDFDHMKDDEIVKSCRKEINKRLKAQRKGYEEAMAKYNEVKALYDEYNRQKKRAKDDYLKEKIDAAIFNELLNDLKNKMDALPDMPPEPQEPDIDDALKYIKTQRKKWQADKRKIKSLTEQLKMGELKAGAESEDFKKFLNENVARIVVKRIKHRTYRLDIYLQSYDTHGLLPVYDLKDSFKTDLAVIPNGVSPEDDLTGEPPDPEDNEYPVKLEDFPVEK